MKRRQIDLFFRELSAGLESRADVILAGAAAGSLMGHVRPSMDIDFEIRARGSSKKNFKQIQNAVQKASQIAGVAVNYSENIGGWSRIHYLNYRKTAVFYKRIGKIRVLLMAPEYWTIGKMARFLELDIQDILKVVRAKKLKAQRLVRLWARALRASDLSLELGFFRDHVMYFLKKYGRRAWGRRFKPEPVIALFKKQAGEKHFK
jgi:hypothetical protein